MHTFHPSTRLLSEKFPGANSDQLQAIQDLISRYRGQINMADKDQIQLATSEIIKTFNEEIGWNVMNYMLLVNGVPFQSEQLWEVLDGLSGEIAEIFANYILTDKFR